MSHVEWGVARAWPPVAPKCSVTFESSESNTFSLILVRLGYPPAIIYKRDRSRYLGALQKADRGESGPLGEMLARAILDNLYRFVIPAVAGPARLVPLSALATPDLEASALRAAAGRGRLRAIRNSSGRWRSSRAWVEEYKATRYRRDRD